MPVFHIHHITRYHYDRPVKESISQIKIFPVDDAFQTVLSSELLITGKPDVVLSKDYFGNTLGDFSVLSPHQELTIDSRISVRTKENWHAPANGHIFLEDVKNAVEKDLSLIWLSEPERIENQIELDILVSMEKMASLPVVTIAETCCKSVYDHFEYKKGITTVETTLDEILEHKSGVCQDFAHILLQMLRTMGLPARYVSGYVCPNESGMRGEGATHAWVEYFLPEYGWIGLDPTNNVFAGPHHVRLASGKNFGDCTPVKGSFKGLAQQSLTVFVSVGYEDGHVYEEKTDVELDLAEIEGTEPWQDELIAQKQQQQQ